MTDENELIEEWTPLVINIASRMTSPSVREDAEQEGMIGLLNAIRTFDESVGTKFVTHATTCIRNSIIDFIRKEKNQTDSMVYVRDLDRDILDRGMSAHGLVERSEVQQRIVDACQPMTEREEYILGNRMLSEEPMTMQEIADEFNVSKMSVQRDEDRLKKQIKENFGGTI